MDERYDVVILGAGINGVGIAKALSLLGKKVLVIEKSHIAAGASSHSSRLIHGGLRYLENFEFHLVKEALHDQKYLLDTYPELVQLRPFYLPVYMDSRRPVWMIRFGLWLYGLFAEHRHKPEQIPKESFSMQFENINIQGLKAVFRYFDGKTNDDELTHHIAKEACEAGATILENREMDRVDVQANDMILHMKGEVVKTNVLVNATGAWIDEVNMRFDFPSSFNIVKLSGIHIIIDRILIPEPLILQTASKRIFFIIPEENTTLIGTTERVENVNIDEIKINEEDIDYLLNESNSYLKTALKREDIKAVIIGVRPIIKSNKDPSDMSREYKLDLHHLDNNKLLHVYGGKLTTFPSLAQKVCDILC